MPRRIIDVRGERWEVAVNGARTQSTKDEFGLRFVRIAGGPREERFARYTPLGSKARETSLADAGRCRTRASFSRTRSRPGPRRSLGTTAERHEDVGGTGPLADLHMHSTASDGSLPPEQVVARAAAAGLAAVALTDHDTVAGVPAALAAGRAARDPGRVRVRVLRARAVGRDARAGVFPPGGCPRTRRVPRRAAGRPQPAWHGDGAPAAAAGRRHR